MIKTNQTSVFYPDYVSTSVLDLNTSLLKNDGITHLAFDIDETIVPKNHNELSVKYVKFMKTLETSGFKLLIASNSKRDLKNITKHFSAILVRPSQTSFKPFKKYFLQVIKAAGTGPEHIAMVGDKVLNDVIGANRAGLKTILVEPYARRQKAHNRFYLQRALRMSK